MGTLSNGDGPKNLVVSQTNAQNLTGSTSRSFVRDNAAPVLTIATPTENTEAKSSVQLMGACENGLAIQISGTGLLSSSTVACGSGAYTAAVNFSSGEGAKNIQVSQTDLAGNKTTISRNFVRDSIAPVLAFVSPAADTSAETGMTITGQCEGTLPVLASGSGLASNVTKACNANVFTMDLVFSNGDGTKSIQISQTDAAGNTGTASRNFKKAAAVNLDGVALYGQNCAACHGVLASSTKQNRTATQISAGISSVPQMSSLSFLTSAQREAIASALFVASNAPAFACTNQNDVYGQLVESHARRLSALQIQRTLSDLLSLFVGSSTAATIASSSYANSIIPKDVAPRYKRWDNNFSSQHAQGLFDLADKVATAISSTSNYTTAVNAAINMNRGTCSTLNTTSPTDACQKQLIRNIGLRILRRPLLETSTENEVNDYQREYTSTTASAAFGNIFFRMLLSPSFLFHLENNETAVSGTDVLKLSSYSIANRLSYTFWNTMPDAGLLSLAQAGDLSTDANFNSAFAYVVGKQSLVNSSIQEFMYDWLKLDNVPQFETNSVSFSTYAGSLNFTPDLRNEMLREMQELGSYVATNGKVSDLFTTEVSFARNTELMKLYGVSQAAATTVTPQNAVSLPAGTRPGVLTRAAMLVTYSGAKNPVRRGVRIRQDILCLHTDPPPPSLPPDSLNSPPFDVSLTARQRYAQKTSASACIGCHSVINPLGDALSNYSGLGLFETTEPAFFENGSYANRQLTVDAKVDLATIVGSGVYAETPKQYMSTLSERPETRKCFTQEYAKYFLNREIASADGCRMNKMNNFTSSTATMKDFVESLARDPQFRFRKVKE